jgi:uncharacterized OB-fold protein
VSAIEPVQPRDGALFADAATGQPTTLCASRCTACERIAFPERTFCPACGADTRPVQLAGPARLRVHTSVLAQPPGSLVEAPYDVGVAEFDEGICIIGLMDGLAQRGDQVCPVVVERTSSGRIFAFRLVQPKRIEER